ncbi:YadA C-terminal domain-containing protein [Escherichia coli]|uniref:YadA C-terminal domain-containing protein n=1 Tax=Escherichia coli TaxID=562 RepID=UPI001CA68D5E|nr:YadA C-terminal domain-containing protein [Escherichia coli]QZY67695.1 YadA-like family protein [Escherichia coli]
MKKTTLAVLVMSSFAAVAAHAQDVATFAAHTALNNEKEIATVQHTLDQTEGLAITNSHNIVSLKQRVLTDSDRIDNAQSRADAAYDKASNAEYQAGVAQTNVNALSGVVSDQGQGIFNNHEALVAAGNEMNAIKADVAGKVDQTLYGHDKVRQLSVDEDQDNGIATNASQIQEVQKAVAATGDVQTTGRYQGMVNAKVAAELSQPKVTPVDHSADIAANKAAITKTQDQVAAMGDVQTASRYQAMTTAKQSAQVEANKAAIQKQTVVNTTYGDQIQTLATAQGETVKEVRSTQKQVSSNTQQIQKLNSNFSNLKDQVNSDRTEYRSGIATATALAGLPQVNANQKFMVSAAAGTFKDASAIAVGGSANLTDHVVVKFGVSDSTEGDAAANVGIGYGF